MAKCLVCGARKGKRVCLRSGGLICSACCGETRSGAECAECVHFQEAGSYRRYSAVPRFDLHEMEHSEILNDYSDVIEGALCLWDLKYLEALRDADAALVLERLLDKHHFGDSAVTSEDPKLQEGLEIIERAILRDLSGLSRETLVKILSVIYFVLRRRGMRGREYLDVIQKYVGLPTGNGSYMRRFRRDEDDE